MREERAQPERGGGAELRLAISFSSAAAALLSLLSKNALPECSAGVSRAVNKVFTAKCERFSCGKKAENFEYMSIRFRNTNGVLLTSYSARENTYCQKSYPHSVVRTLGTMMATKIPFQTWMARPAMAMPAMSSCSIRNGLLPHITFLPAS